MTDTRKDKSISINSPSVKHVKEVNASIFLRVNKENNPKSDKFAKNINKLSYNIL